MSQKPDVDQIMNESSKRARDEVKVYIESWFKYHKHYSKKTEEVRNEILEMNAQRGVLWQKKLSINRKSDAISKEKESIMRKLWKNKRYAPVSIEKLYQDYRNKNDRAFLVRVKARKNDEDIIAKDEAIQALYELYSKYQRRKGRGERRIVACGGRVEDITRELCALDREYRDYMRAHENANVAKILRDKARNCQQMAESVQRLYKKLNQLGEGDPEALETILSEGERALVSWTVKDNSDRRPRRHSGKRKRRSTQQSSWSESKKASAKKRKKKRKSSNTAAAAAEWDVTPRNYRYPPPLPPRQQQQPRRLGTSPSWTVFS